MGYFIAFIVIIVLAAIGKIGMQKQLKKQYDEALLGTDKRKALETGRKYYSALRNGKLTQYDEQAIANDISTMKNE
jgi:hypothetical protein